MPKPGDYQTHHLPSDIARRSTSIFSRRGASNDQEPKAPVVHVALMAISRPHIITQYSWSEKINGLVRSETTTCPPHNRKDARTSTSKRTVLNAVPPSYTTRTRTLDRHSLRHSDTEHRIGTWINGVAHFDQSPLHYGTNDVLLYEDPDSTISTPTAKPPLSVRIPGSARSSSSSLDPLSVYTNRPLAIEIAAPLDTARLHTPDPQSANHLRAGCHRSRPSQSSASSRARTDESSPYSRPSSFTSVDTKTTASPVQAGVLDDISPRSRLTNIDINKALPPTPVAAPSILVMEAEMVNSTRASSQSLRNTASQRKGTPSVPFPRRTMTELRHSQYAPTRRHTSSPTLSQAELELSTQLSAMSTQSSSWLWADDLLDEQQHMVKPPPIPKRHDSVREVMQPPLERAPTLPKRSRKRDWRARGQRGSQFVRDQSLPVPTRRRSESHLATLSNNASERPLLRRTASMSGTGAIRENLVPLVSQRVLFATAAPAPGAEPPSIPAPPRGDDVTDHIKCQSSSTEISSRDDDNDDVELSVPATSAEVVLLDILCALTSLRDLFNTAIINRGMYRVYKEHEMQLIKAVICNESAPAAELREWKHPDVPDIPDKLSSDASPVPQEHTPTSYVASYWRDLDVVHRLKSLIHDKCGTFVRPETTFALSTPTHPHAQRFDDALYRIWCFTFIFGSNKGREEDLTNQLNWLQGDSLDDYSLSATIVDFDMSNGFLAAPTHFALGNRGGLTPAQLYDMTEMWTCLGSLLHGYRGRVGQARDSGVFDHCDVVEGDIENEGRLLEEWLAYLLTLGPDVVLEMAVLASDNSASGFSLARQRGWTTWRPPVYNSSLCNFLKEPMAIIYSEQILAANHRPQDAQEREQKLLSRRRVASMAAEIRLRRQSSDYKRLPLIDMASERPMSIMSRSSTTRSSATATLHHPASSSSSSSSSSLPPPASAQGIGHSRSPTPCWTPPTHSISPILEDDNKPDLPLHNNEPRRNSHLPANPLLLHQFAPGANNTSDMAVHKLVSMGFPVTDAKKALKVTDDGESLRVDRAVEYLLRSQYPLSGI